VAVCVLEWTGLLRLRRVAARVARAEPQLDERVSSAMRESLQLLTVRRGWIEGQIALT
jgi:hypothetical protein